MVVAVKSAVSATSVPIGYAYPWDVPAIRYARFGGVRVITG